MKYLVRSMLFALALMVGSSPSVTAQSTKTVKKEPAVAQYCPVAYAAMSKAVKGEMKFASTYKGKTYYMLSEEAKKMFDAEPTKYIPQYGGQCATAMAMGKKLESDPEIFSVYKAKTYLFSSKEAKAIFDKAPQVTITKADKQFALLENSQR